MVTSRFQIFIGAPPASVFALLADYAGYAQLPHVKWARVDERGKEHAAGVGALRVLNVDGITFHERIVEFEEGRVIAYKIEKSTPLRVRHEIGRMVLSERSGGTDLEWVTTYEAAVPLVSRLLTPVVKWKLERTFRDILDHAKAQLEARARAA